MSSDKAAFVAHLRPEDITAKQWRTIFYSAQRMGMLRDKREEDDKESEDDSASSENDDLVNLAEEKKGDSKPPKVTKEDLPKGVKLPEEDDEEEQIASKKKGKK